MSRRKFFRARLSAGAIPAMRPYHDVFVRCEMAAAARLAPAGKHVPGDACGGDAEIRLLATEEFRAA